MEIQMTTTALLPLIPNQVPSSAQQVTTMKWISPRIVEIAVGLEINAYACAELN